MMITTPAVAAPTSPPRALERASETLAGEADQVDTPGDSGFARQLGDLQNSERARGDSGEKSAKRSVTSNHGSSQAGSNAAATRPSEIRGERADCVRQGTIRDGADADQADVDADPAGAAAAQTLTAPPDLAAALALLTAANARPRTATIDGSVRIDQSRAEPSTHRTRLVSGPTSAIMAVASTSIAGHVVHATAGARLSQAALADTSADAAALTAALAAPSALDPIALATGISTPEAGAVPDASPSGPAIAIDVAAFKRDGVISKFSGVSVERRVDQDMRSPQFGPALGAQVTLLTREGVQQARLTLHPAEMGPISVQIAVDGKVAHVDFHAEVAATRSAIEASLPALASALRDAGFTLAGGGVFQHHGGGRQHTGHQAPAGDARPSASSDSDQAPGLVAPALGRGLSGRGLVDLYA